MALSFIFGGNTGETPASIKQKRDLIRSLMGASAAPKNVGEGLNALGDGIVANVLDRRANAAETAGQNSANSMFDSLLGGGGGASGLAASSPAIGAAPSSAAVAPGNPNDIQTQFLDTVKGGYDTGNGQKLAVTNPFGLAAIAATGKAESGWSPQNAGGTWADGKNPAGGIMSWNGPRLENLQKFAGGTNGTPQQQAQFFLQENPGLIQKLNNAGSVEEAQNLMNNAWAFKGYNQPGNPNAAHRLALANGYLPQFQGSPQAAAQAPAQAPNQVASLDPSAGMPMPAAAQQLQTSSPVPTNIPVPTPRPQMQTTAPSGYVDPRVSAPNSIQQPQAQPASAQPATTSPFVPQSMTQPANQQASASAPPVQVAQNAAPTQAQQPQGVDPRYLRALSNPWLSDGQKQGIQLLINQQLQQQQQAQEQQNWMARQQFEQQQRQADPANQLAIQKAQADLANTQTPAQQEATWRARQDYERQQQASDPLRQAQLAEAQAKLDQLQHSPGDVKVVGNQLVRVGRDGQVTDITPKAGAGGQNGGFRFNGNAVDAQALNGLIDSGQLSPEQAQQIAAGKTITGPNGEMMFMTPQSIFGQNGAPLPQQQQPAPQQQGIDIFAGQQMQQPGPQIQNQPQAQPPIAQPQVQPQNIPQAAPVQQQFIPQQQGNGPIPLTAPKAASDSEKNAAGYADRMNDAQSQLGQYENQGLNGWDQFLTQNRFVPGILGNSIVGNTNPDYQLFDQARRNFINSQLRRESGAVISPEEFDNANKQYFPQPGDSPEVIAQKRQNRESAYNSMVRAAGPTYKPAQGAPKKKTNIGGYTIEEVSP